jgi:hypothetical protein
LYFLPKIHKPISQWRNQYHPKMRPILSNCGTATQPLEKHLLPTLQKIESTFSTNITTSLSVTNDILELNEQFSFPTNTLLSTIDVESLYTRIPLDKLWDILKILILQQIPGETEREQFLHFLFFIIHNNIFKANGKCYHQTTGLPMGGVLSGVLANIYLAYLERNILHSSPSIPSTPKFYLFERFVDDIFIISSLCDSDFQHFLSTLSATYHLTLTSTSNHHCVNFLDMSIKFVDNKLVTQPYSKNTLLYPLPSCIGKRNISRDINILKSQILRTYRLSSDNDKFSLSIKNYIQSLSQHHHHILLKKSIMKFLKPIRNASNWSCNVPLCNTCQQKVSECNIKLRKCTKIDSRIIAIKSPMNCQTTNIHVIHQSTNNTTTIQLERNLHQFLSTITPNTKKVIPIGRLKLQSIQKIFRQFPSIHHPNRQQILNMKCNPPCFIHPIVRNPSNVYGAHCANKKQRKVWNLFGAYRKICQ